MRVALSDNLVRQADLPWIFLEAFFMDVLTSSYTSLIHGPSCSQHHDC